MEDKKIRVGITHGDTNGVGYELIFKTFSEPAMLELCTPIIYGSPKVAAYHRNALEMECNFTIVNSAAEARDGRINMVAAFDEEIKVSLGTPTEESGTAGLRALDLALEDYRNGMFDVLVTAPISNSEAFQFSGQSRYIEDHTDSFGKGLTILVNEKLRIALATRNLPLRQVTESLTPETVKEKTTALHASLKRDFRISNPRIAVLAINPKAGENGLLGSEEQDIIAPAIKELEENGIQAYGPYAADEFFGQGYYADFDGVVAMYYDQAFMPFRSLSDEEGINYTAGLPMVRTAPATGCSFDIAGQGVADEQPFRHALYLAIDIHRNRITYDEPMGNPLKKLYRERRDESEKVRFAIPKKTAREDDKQNKNAQEQA